ncbi:MAG: Rieske (2Fe-2S) protein [Pirellulales bacterium]
MMAEDFVPAAAVSDIPDPGSLLVEVDDRLVVLVRVGGEFFALDDVCTHDGGPLSSGPIEEKTILCPRHGARFDLRDGRPLSMPATQPTTTHEVRVEGDQVLIRLANR